jgi:hypothetical protein
MDSNYYDELEAKAKSASSRHDIGNLCYSFNRKLKTLDTEMYTEVTSLFYALIYMYSVKTGQGTGHYPQAPRVSKMNGSEFLFTWTLSKFPETLRGIMVGYMSDCISSL